MREHMGLYRGKRIDNGEWVEGYFAFHGQELSKASDTNRPYILAHDELGFIWRQVDPSTVGQYTGLTDKNGKQVFEGDVVYDGFTKDKVVFEDCQWKLVDRHGMWINLFNREVEIIGNIHDNPELLKEGADNG